MSRFLLGLALLGLGFGAVNYGRPANREHHIEWAEETGLPAPSDAIMYGGGVVGVLGLLVMLRAVVRKRA